MLNGTIQQPVSTTAIEKNVDKDQTFFRDINGNKFPVVELAPGLEIS